MKNEQESFVTADLKVGGYILLFLSTVFKQCHVRMGGYCLSHAP
jgi:hypothetical protein